jgi:hydroxymethylpyrimidine pyrophosphatase-like HAD family hydrolase
MNTPPVRVVAFDLDGTLLRSDGSISARTLAALAATRAAGLHLVAVTARPPRRVRALVHDTGLNGVAICSNGAVVYDIDHDTIITATAIPVERACALIARLRAALPGVAFGIEAGTRYGCEPHYAIQVEDVHDARDPGMEREDASVLCRLGLPN